VTAVLVPAASTSESWIKERERGLEVLWKCSFRAQTAFETKKGFSFQTNPKNLGA
jgi:hypothetical protein